LKIFQRSVNNHSWHSRHSRTHPRALPGVHTGTVLCKSGYIGLKPAVVVVHAGWGGWGELYSTYVPRRAVQYSTRMYPVCLALCPCAFPALAENRDGAQCPNDPGPSPSGALMSHPGLSGAGLASPNNCLISSSSLPNCLLLNCLLSGLRRRRWLGRRQLRGGRLDV